MSKDTPMRDRQKPRTNSKPHIDRRALPEQDRTAPVVRIFSPSELDLDDLAEAIRSLLEESAGQPQVGPSSRPNPDLLSFPRRVSHVVGP